MRVNTEVQGGWQDDGLNTRLCRSSKKDHDKKSHNVTFRVTNENFAAGRWWGGQEDTRYGARNARRPLHTGCNGLNQEKHFFKSYKTQEIPF